MSRTRHLATGMSLLVATSLAAIAPAVAEDEQAPARAAAAPSIVSSADARGDVRLRSGEGPSKAARRSIDIHRVVIRRTPARTAGARVRFAVRIRESRPRARYDQMAFFVLRPAGGGAKLGDIGFTTRGRLAYASWGPTPSGDYVSCDPLRSRVVPGSDTVHLDVPRRCLPDRPVRITVRTVTGVFRSDAPTYSADRLVVPGVHDLRR